MRSTASSRLRGAPLTLVLMIALLNPGLPASGLVGPPTAGRSGHSTGSLAVVAEADSCEPACITQTIPMPFKPYILQYDDPSNSIIAAAIGSATIMKLSSSDGSILASVVVPGGATAISVDPSSQLVFVTGVPDRLSIISDSDFRLIKTLTVGQAPSAMAVASASDRLFIADTGSGNISVVSIQTLSVKSTISILPFDPVGLSLASSGVLAVAAASLNGSREIVTISTSSLQLLGEDPFNGSGAMGPEMAYEASSNSLLLLTNTGNLTVYSLDSNSIVQTVPLAAQPTTASAPPCGFGIDAQRGLLFAEASGSSVDILSLRPLHVVESLPPLIDCGRGPLPYSIAVDSTHDEAFVADFPGANLSVLSYGNSTSSTTPYSGLLLPIALLVVGGVGIGIAAVVVRRRRRRDAATAT